MNSRNTIQDELNELNSGLNSDSINPYSVPEGYFEGLAASVLAKIKVEASASAMEELMQLSPFLAGIPKKMPYAVPENYFLSNIESLKAFTSENEDSLVLSFIDKEMPYEVPTGYFANVPEQVLGKVSNGGAKVVPIQKRKWMRLAVAAAIIGIMAVSGFFYFNNRGNSGTISDPVTAVKKASTEELNDFINATAVTDDKSQVTVNNNLKEKKLFADVSDKELNDFLDQMPTDDEIDIN
jgi:hypothetical protein